MVCTAARHELLMPIHDLRTSAAELHACLGNLPGAGPDLDRQLAALNGSRAAKGGAYQLVDPAADAATISAKQRERARRRRGRPRTHIRTRVALGLMPAPR